jgi:hypothetical protein
MSDKNEELKNEELERAQGGANYEASAEATGRRRSKEWDPKTDPGGEVPVEQLKGIYGGGPAISSQQTENRGARGDDPEYVIQDPHGGFDRKTIGGEPKP